MTRKSYPPAVEAMRRRLEEAAKEQPEPRFGARRTRKPRRRMDARTAQQEIPFPCEVQE